MISCDKKSILEDYYTEITNKELEYAIAEYDSMVKKEATYPYIIKVVSESMGDTLINYTIMFDYSPATWNICPILYIANVNGKDVSFRIEGHLPVIAVHNVFHALIAEAVISAYPSGLQMFAIGSCDSLMRSLVSSDTIGVSRNLAFAIASVQ